MSEKENDVELTKVTVSLDEVSTNSLPKAASNLYKTLPLPAEKRCIRVLDVDAADADDDDAPIKSRLRIVNLDEHPRYAALSYVWGTFANPRNTIVCDGHSMELTSNCWSALWHLRKVLGHFTIWVDAICINQQDSGEKVSQILLMQEIFSAATPTYLWLGDGDSESDAGMDYLSTAGFQRFLTPQSETTYIVPRQPLMHFNIALYSYLSAWVNFTRGGWKLVVNPFPKTWDLQVILNQEKVSNVLSRGWLDRIWSLQETVLSNRPVICCGTKLLPWRCIICYIVLARYMQPDSIDEHSVRWYGLVELWFWIHRRNEHTNPDEVDTDNMELDIEDSLRHYTALLKGVHRCVGLCVLLLFSGALSTIILPTGYTTLSAFDKNNVIIVACVLLLAAWVIVLVIVNTAVGIWLYRLKPPSGPIMMTDEPPEETHWSLDGLHGVVIREITSRTATNRLDQAFGLHSILRELGIPIASPDYSLPPSTVYRDLFVHLLDWTNSLHPLLCVSNGTSMRTSWSPDWSTSMWDSWIERKYLIDQPHIHATSSGPPHAASSVPRWIFSSDDSMILRGRIVGRIAWLCQPFIDSSKSHLHDDDAQEQNTETMRNLMLYLQRPPSVNQIELFVHRYHRSTSRHGSISKRDFAAWVRCIWKTRKHEAQESLDIMRKGLSRQRFAKHRAICNDLGEKKRTLFVTDSGTIGNGPESVEVADQIALFWGLPVPLILRHHGLRYRLVGFAEVDGMMQSELWQDVNVEALEQIALS